MQPLYYDPNSGNVEETHSGVATAWVGSDGNLYYGDGQYGSDVQNWGKFAGNYEFANGGIRALNGNTPLGQGAGFAPGVTQIADPVGGGSSSYSGGSTVDSAEAQRLAAEEAERQALRGEIGGYTDDLEDLYTQLFADLDALISARSGELETQYGDQLAKASKQYSSAIPEIEGSYAAIGAADSTDTTYSKNNAKEGFDETTKTIGANKDKDKAALGQYAKETKTTFETERDSAKKNIERAASTDDVEALRGFRNSVESTIDSGKVKKSTLGTDEGARGEISKLTQDAGRFDSAMSALDNIIKSSMSGAVKGAAVKAITDSAGLSDEEKKKVDEMYGNVYAEQSAL